MNDLNNLNNTVNNGLNSGLDSSLTDNLDNGLNIYNDSLLLEGEKAPKKRFSFINKKFFIFLFIVLLLIAIFHLVYAIMTKSFSSYDLEADIPEYIYMNEPVSFNTNFIGDKSNRFYTNYVLGNEYVFSLLKYENAGLKNTNTIIPIQEGNSYFDVSGVVNPSSSIFVKDVLTRRYRITVCPEFSLDLLKYKNISIKKGSFYNLGIDFGENKCSEGINYEIGNSSIATVNNLGMVSGINVGETNLTISKDNKKIIVPVYVTQGKILVKSSKSKYAKVQLVSGEKIRMNFDYDPFNATNVNVRYVSSSSSVASVNDKGLVEANGIGTSVVRAISDDSVVLAEMTVVVEDPTDKPEIATNIEVSESEINMKTGESRKIMAVVVPDGALKSKLKWSTSNQGIITVDKNGIVYARKNGTAYVYIVDGNVKKSILVNVG